MYAVSKDELIKKILGGEAPEAPRLDIPADWDPDVIREITTNKDDIATNIVGFIKTWVITGLLAVALIAQLFEVSLLNQFCLGIFSGLMVVSGAGAVMDRFFMDRNERAGNYTRVARFVFRSGSSYWKYKDFNEDIARTFGPISYVAVLVAATITLGWYLGLFFLVLTTLANAYMIHMRDTKARALIIYKEKWDAQVELDQEEVIRRAEEDARNQAEIEKILLESGGEAPEPPVEANAVDADGPAYVSGDDLPEDMDLATYNQRIIRVEDQPTEKDDT